MPEQQPKASLVSGRLGWCVVFRHPVCSAGDGQRNSRVRYALGTHDPGEAQRLVEQLNEMLGNQDYWALAAREVAAIRFDPKVVAAFYGPLELAVVDPWRCERN